MVLSYVLTQQKIILGLNPIGRATSQYESAVKELVFISLTFKKLT